MERQQAVLAEAAKSNVRLAQKWPGTLVIRVMLIKIFLILWSMASFFP